MKNVSAQTHWWGGAIRLGSLCEGGWPGPLVDGVPRLGLVPSGGVGGVYPYPLDVSRRDVEC
jgi:hypothetical protein